LAVEVSDDGVRRVLGDGRVFELSRDDLGEVRVITTVDGPFAGDVFFVLAAADGARDVEVPQAQATGEFLEWLQRLPGFDNAAFTRAMHSVVEDEFVLWRADPDGR
jgi:hypothetical protein